MNKFGFSLAFLVLLFGCNKGIEDVVALKQVGSNIHKADQALIDLKYEEEAIQIIENGKLELQMLLPNIISAQIDLIKENLDRASEQSLLSYSLEETNIMVRNVNWQIADSLLKDELRVNKVYYEIINRLSILNERYAGESSVLLKDYYEVHPFILAEDVLRKIDELIVDENDRIVREKVNNRVSDVTSIVSVIPIWKISAVMVRISQRVVKVRNSIAGSTLSEKVFIDKILPLFSDSQKLSNNINNLTSKARQTAVDLGMDAVDSRSVKHASEFFKSQDNQIKGRIGDFSDGIITQPIANLRKIMKDNILIIERYSIVPK